MVESMPIILDTFNVLHTVGVLPPDLAGIDVQGLVGLLKSSRYRDEKVILACDGKPQPDLIIREPNMTIRFSGPGNPADDLIGQLVRASTAPRRLIVVSTDHAVQRTARKRRCQVLTSEAFLAQLAEDAKIKIDPASAPSPQPKPGHITAEQVERWINVFDIDETRINELLKTPLATPLDDKPTSASEPKAGNLPVERNDRDDRDEIKPVIPPSLIEQAERLWREQSGPGKSMDDPLAE